jgi:hypothetical protein
MDSDWLSWQREIRDQLEMDGQTVESVVVDSESIKIKASYV